MDTSESILQNPSGSVTSDHLHSNATHRAAATQDKIYDISVCFQLPTKERPRADKFWHLPCSVTDIGNGQGRNWMTTPGNTEKAARDALEWSPQEPSFSTQIPPGYKALCQQSPYLKCNRSDIKLLKTRHKNTLKEAAKWWSTRSFTR